MRCRQFTLADLNLIRSVISQTPKACRQAIAREVCSAWGWCRSDGNMNLMAARVVLLRLHRDGLITLPPPKFIQSQPKPRLPSQQLSLLTAPMDLIELPVSGLLPLSLVRVKGKALSALWNEYMGLYHYLGWTVLKGAQIRYIVDSPLGHLAAFGFASAAFKVADRDNWIGWDSATRIANLRYVVNNTRFLILPWVRSRNLASKLLAMAAKQLPTDWNEQYGYTPVLLETFVEMERFTGACYKAANWTSIGATLGRGRNDVHTKYGLPRKLIFTYPLRSDFRKTLLVQAPPIAGFNSTPS